MDKLLFMDFGGETPLVGILEGKKAHFIKSKTRDGIGLLAETISGFGNKLKGIIAETGAGSFSAVRGAALAANMLAWLLDVPVLGIRRKENESAEEVALRAAAAFASGRKSRHVLPHYYAEPNITKPKKL